MKTLLLVLTIGAWAATAFAQSFAPLTGQEQITAERYCSKPIKVALFEFGVLFRASNGDGIDSRLLAALEAKTGCKMERVLMPRKRIWLELERGTLDMATAGVPTQDRLAYAYAIPYFSASNHVLVRADKAAQATSVQALENSNLRLGVVRGFKHEPFYDALIERISVKPGRVVEAVDLKDNLRMLDRGVVDAIFSQPVVYNEYLSSKKLGMLVVRKWAPHYQTTPGALMLQRNSFTPAQAQAWDQLVERMIKDGSMGQIYRRFLSPADAKNSLYTGPRILN